MRLSRRAFAVLATATLLAAPAFAPAVAQDAAPEPLPSLSLLAPASAGSGYDQLARVIQTVMQEQGLASGIEVENVAGGGGTVGLAQFVTSSPRGPAALVMGFALVGGVLTTQSGLTLADTVPVARLMGENDVIVVPADSPIQDLAGLVEALKADPGAVSWAGGNIGGIDHVIAGLFAKAAGVDPTQINYVVHSGGGEVLASILGGQTTVGISGYEEFAPQIEAGELRALGVSGPERIPGIEIPTFQEGGVDLAVVNWRGIAAHPSMSEEDRAALAAAIDAMVASEPWKAALAERGWTDTYLAGEEFTTFLAEEEERVRTALSDAGIL
ncbi:Bug family tripartite tricarboxylate transporter substrate binding protein [Rubellimicrobium aerolatum]|uniref:Bug family tripartite tricarboxylate transporter substrate binding protein n=1 Tax=Rubellimicrobium aerolatum TaxID=490979 RepID=A0ABW0SG80_9RHOB|nr:tripartite tricarboxylate transporter substrate-binding protein [Rubellimicrobium aerolatum]MBP1807371.1 putative tricarboxylic transport membrane protein [Rubellimicrobium aerolatum]